VAHQGTLFLDEVALLPPILQAKLLKVLEDGVVRRLGSTRGEQADISVISATNEDLSASIRSRRFREDLFHRLAGITLSLPPLRERGDDITLLVEQALARACARFSGPAKQLSADALAALRVYRWPGNVRELNSVIERAVLLCPTRVIPFAALGIGATPELLLNAPYGAADLDVEALQRQRLSEALARTGWNISRTATLLGVTRNTVRARIARYGLRSIADPEAGAPAAARAADADEPVGLPSRSCPSGWRATTNRRAIWATASSRTSSGRWPRCAS
jgi:DNA-binding NtrC family response regulator